MAVMRTEMTFQDFIVKAPLYSSIQYENITNEKEIFSVVNHPNVLKFDEFCTICQKDSVFQFNPIETQNKGVVHQRLRSMRPVIDEICFVNAVCMRCHENYVYILILRSDDIAKCGQWPSLADIVKPNLRRYRDIFDNSDLIELTRADGLAAHGVGIGAFCYLRRVFENLIRKRFNESKHIINVDEEDFSKKRMNEKIDILKQFIPEFVFKNKEVYGILSKGIHELEEQACLDIFPLIMDTIIFMLNEDKKKKEDRHDAAFVA